MEISGDLLQANVTIITGVLILLSIIYAITPQDQEFAKLERGDFIFIISMIVYIFIGSIVMILVPRKNNPPSNYVKWSKIFFISGLSGVFLFIALLAFLL